MILNNIGEKMVRILILIGLISISSISQASLIAFYTFEGNSSDISSNGNHGSVSGATLTNSGFEGQAYSFDGSNDFITIPVNLNPTVMPLLTLGAWVNADTANAIRAIVSHDNGSFDRGIGIDQRGAGSAFRYSAFTGSGVVSAGSDPLDVGEWNFISARYNSATTAFTLDVNGDRVASSTSSGLGFNTTRIGSNPGFGEFFDGLIDNVFIYDEFLTDSQIDNIRLGGSNAILDSTVPAPTIVWLLASGLIGLIGIKKTSSAYA